MPLFARSFQELMTDSIEDLASNTNITRLSAGGFARALLEAVNKRLAEVYEVFDLNMARAFVSSAPGQYLDMIGLLLGVTRESSVAANVTTDTQVIKFYVDTGTFGTINGGSDILVPQGTILSTRTAGAGITYRTIEEATLPLGQNSAWIAAEAAIPGEEANVGSGSLLYHDFTDYTDSDSSTLLVTNVHPISNGKNFESDANYRFRIVNRALEAEAANLTAIRLAALSTPGVADVILIRRYRGIGTFGVIIQSILPVVSTSLIEAVTANVAQVQAYGEIAYIRAPRETGISMKLVVHYNRRLSENELLEIEDDLKRSITEEINGLDIGDTFYVNKLVANLFMVSDEIANFGETGQPIKELYVHKESQLEDNRVRQKLLGDHVPESDERVIVEPSLSVPITLERQYVRR
jgi:uncharacterized phage protein gp47/JayE